MKKYLIICSLVILCHSFSPLFLNADAGPKPSIKITASNVPDNSLFYMDLLIPDDSDNDSAENFDQTGYNLELINRIKNHGIRGHVPFTISGKSFIQNQIECRPVKGKCVFNYTYMIPGKFYIIAAADNGDTVISNIVEPKSFSSRINFDFKSGEALEESGIFIYISHFFSAALVTILLEGAILVLFGFPLIKNLRLLLSVNISTQLLLTSAIAFASHSLGIIGSVVIFFPVEAIIFIIEELFLLFTLRSIPEKDALYFP